LSARSVDQKIRADSQAALKARGTGKKNGERANYEVEKDPAVENEKADQGIVEVREEIDKLIRTSAKEIAKALIDAAMLGEVSPAKYLFEAIGLYPATEETLRKPQEQSLAERLLKRMGLPTEPVTGDEGTETSERKSALAGTSGDI
jgi:hypothetical protein